MYTVATTMYWRWGNAFLLCAGPGRRRSKTRLPQGARLGYQACGEATFPPHLTQTQRGANDTHVIALRPQLARHRGFVMTDRRLSAPISNARRIAVSTIAATLLSATGFSVDTAVAQQPPATPRPAAPAPGRPGTPAPAPPAAQKPGAPAAQKPPVAPPGQAQGAQGATPEMPQLV